MYTCYNLFRRGPDENGCKRFSVVNRMFSVINIIAIAAICFKVLSGFPPKRGLKYYVASQYRVLKYYGRRRRSQR